MAGLSPAPLHLKRKPMSLRVEDLEPADTTFQPTQTTKCCGVLHGQGVVVTLPQHMWALVRLGAYGKGSFSRTIPCHQHIPSYRELSRKRKAVSSEEMETLWRKRHKLHSEWKKEVGGIGVEDIAEGEIATKDINVEAIAEVTAVERIAVEEIKDIAVGEIATKDMNMKDIAEDIAVEEIADTAVGESSVKVAESEPVKALTKEVDTLRDDYQCFISRLEALKRDDPYHIEEYLLLGAEEAFYLVSEAKVLRVEGNGAAMTDSELWHHFTSLNSSFCSRYAAYRHYRAGNWVPKSGLKFGVDFVLYKESPLSYHSSFTVIVKEGGGSDGTMTWKDVIALGRVSESAVKDLLVCQVAWPRDMAEGGMREPGCVNVATVTDVLVQRWVPERDR